MVEEPDAIEDEFLVKYVFVNYLLSILTLPEGTWDQRYPTPCKGHGTRDTLPPLVNRMAHPCENITFPQLRWRAVNVQNHKARQGGKTLIGGSVETNYFLGWEI